VASGCWGSGDTKPTTWLWLAERPVGAAELVLEHAEVMAVGLDAERAGKRGHRILDIDDSLSGADGFAGQVDED